MKTIVFLLSIFLLLSVPGLFVFSNGQVSKDIPDPPDSKIVNTEDTQTAIVAGGCFWGIEAIYEQLDGVIEASSGYAGGEKKHARYDVVSSGTSGHAESVLITYNPRKISYGTILKVFFTVAHDPTQLNYQGPDYGTQYRSAIFYVDDEQKRVAEEYIEILEKEGVFTKPIVTQVVPLVAFYPAEDYHQNFLTLNPTNPYIVHWDIPKLENLKKTFPELIGE